MRIPFCWTLFALLLISSRIQAAGPHVFAGNQIPHDDRLKPLKDLNGYFPFRPSETVDEWNERAEKLRRRMLVALGLWPMPSKTPANAVIHGKMAFDDYTLEKVYLESFPGFYVTGSLYRPKQASGKCPAVLTPHGHFRDGRAGSVGADTVKNEIAKGGERFADSSQNKIQARSVQLARMGCVVFAYDMIGYVDSVQIPYDIAHRFAKQRPEMNVEENWGLFSPQAESNLQSVMGMQTYNSIRALDWLASLPDVDPKRIGVTGASGGGTQTFILSALDPRVAVSVPAVMVSTAMQGGCTCENANLLRVSAGNVDFAALFAPKPLCLVSADDWTREMATKGYPELRQHYLMFQAADRLRHAPFLQFGHNYNAVSRNVMYEWMNRHLELGIQEPIQERDFTRLNHDQITVWNREHPQPESSPDVERRVLAWWTDDANLQLRNLRPTNPVSFREYQHVVGGALEAIIGRTIDDVGTVTLDELTKQRHSSYLEMTGKLTHQTRLGWQEQLPTVFLYPDNWSGKVVIWLDGNGKSSLYEESGKLSDPISKLLNQGTAVVGLDLFLQGEFLNDGRKVHRTRQVGNTREVAAYTFGYNDTVFARRVHDVLTITKFVANHEKQPAEISIVGYGICGPLVAAARPLASGQLTKAIMDISGFRFGKVTDFHDPNFLPGGAKYNDVPGMLALSASQSTWVLGEEWGSMQLVALAHRAAKTKQEFRGSATMAKTDEIVAWLNQ